MGNQFYGSGRVFAALGLTIILLASGAYAAALETDDPSTSAVWIDRPLDGSNYGVDDQVVHVVGHVAVPTGADMVRLDIDDEPYGEATLPGESGQLATVEFNWEPSAGIHVLSLWARDIGGDWRGPARVTVTVEGAVDVPPDTTSTTTSTSTTTPAPTTTDACLFDPPIPLTPADGSVTPLVANTLSWSYNGCRLALEFQVEVSTTPAFSEIAASSTVAGANEWLTPGLACNNYWWRVRPKTHDATGPWSAPQSFTISVRGC
ncbi:MAG: hypothetical protein GY926_12660 [bacterium]|nr:hypothetical protein [bacterium]MCP4966072.1 hypothetical protein [bacterium]